MDGSSSGQALARRSRGLAGELGRQPYKARRFLIRYQDRVLFGTDLESAKSPGYEVYARVLETEDEYFGTEPANDRQGFWMRTRKIRPPGGMVDFQSREMFRRLFVVDFQSREMSRRLFVVDFQSREMSRRMFVVDFNLARCPGG